MNILEQLKNIDFKIQYIEILFIDNTEFKTPFMVSLKDAYLQNPPKLYINDDEMIIIKYGDYTVGFKIQSILKIKIGKIFFR